MDFQNKSSTRFHSHHGQNIGLYEHSTVALRESSFAHGMCLSEKPIRPGEIFLVEIERNERGWSGHLRIGLTQHNPNNKFELPQYALPDLSNRGQAWICAVSKSAHLTRAYILDMDTDDTEEYKSFIDDVDYIKTSRGLVGKSLLLPKPKVRICASGEPVHRDCDMLPTDTGSRIGLVYTVKDNKAYMHFIINGEDQGIVAGGIAYDGTPMYAVVDVYGTTKQVRIIQLYKGLPTLQNLCRDVILKKITKDQVSSLPLPNKLKEFLRYEVF